MADDLRPRVVDISIREVKMKVNSEGRVSRSLRKLRFGGTGFLGHFRPKSSIERPASEVMRPEGNWV